MIVRFFIVGITVLLPAAVFASSLRSAAVRYDGGAATYQAAGSQHVICDDCPARNNLAPAPVTVPPPQSSAPERLIVEGIIPTPFTLMPAHASAVKVLPALQASHVSPLVTVYFTINSTRLAAVEKRRLREAVAAGIDSDVIVRVEGHTCRIGKTAYNRKLSVRRARAVSDYLKSLGVPVSEVVGLGKSKPLAGPLSKNRRAEIIIKERNYIP
jgi:outer membrane protein OmpA-like peptidoglycan-associated protein